MKYKNLMDYEAMKKDDRSHNFPFFFNSGNCAQRFLANIYTHTFISNES